MYKADVQPVLRCGQCNKPFDKGSTLKRHGYYCRSRKVGFNARSRSCNSCAKAKVRCDNKHPQCSRCLRKAVVCDYPQGTAEKKAPRTRNRTDAPTSQREVEPPAFEYLRVIEDGSTWQEIDSEIPNIDYTTLEVDASDPDLNFADLFGSQMNNEPNQYPSLDTSHLPSSSFGNITNSQQLAGFPDPWMQTLLTSSIRTFNLRPKHKPSAQRIAQLIFNTLKSYPRMIIRDNALPPFIHPQMVYNSAENEDVEPMTNCISLLYMLRSNFQGSRKLFWKNVRFECERLHADHSALNKWELLAAMQALSIYILIRLDEGETDDNNIDSLLVTAVIVIATQFNAIDKGVTLDVGVARHNDSLETSWTEWMLEESARRLCVVYQVVNMLVYFEPAAMCELHQADLLLAPLPAKKQLWEAGSEHLWKAECDRDPGVLHMAFGMAVNGQLVKIDRVHLNCSDVSALHPEYPNTTTVSANSAATWDEWCAGMDGFGGIVMLAASLVA